MDWQVILVGWILVAIVAFLVWVTRRGRHVRLAEEQAAQKIVNDFGATIEEFNLPGAIYDTNLLPHPKIKIRQAIRKCAELAKDEHQRSVLSTGDVLLATFQPNVGDVPLKPPGMDLVEAASGDADAILAVLDKRDGDQRERYEGFQSIVDREQRDCIRWHKQLR